MLNFQIFKVWLSLRGLPLFPLPVKCYPVHVTSNRKASRVDKMFCFHSVCEQCQKVACYFIGVVLYEVKHFTQRFFASATDVNNTGNVFGNPSTLAIHSLVIGFEQNVSVDSAHTEVVHRSDA